MKLAKNHLDIGLFTNDIDAHTAFWGNTVGLRLDQRLPFVDGSLQGNVQHRYDAHGSVIKVNHFPRPLPQRQPGGYATLTIARDGAAAWAGQDPDGDGVRLVPTGTDGVVGIGVTVRTPDPARLMRFYVEAMEFERLGPQTARCGDTLLLVEPGPAHADGGGLLGPAFRYLTVQIFDADRACDEIVARGGRLAMAPVSFGTVARYGFVADPDGNWIEISARASLTGMVPPR